MGLARRIGALPVALAGALTLAACTSATSTSATASAKPAGASAGAPAAPSAASWPGPNATAFVQGPITAPGGPFLYDRYGRVVIMHGVNAVFKRPPFELVPAPGKPWNFTSEDAKRMAKLGFDVVRLGILWQGLEPGHGGINDPATCTHGPPGHPHEYDQATVDRYLARLAKTVRILGEYGIFSLIDMHQDVWNQAFEGEGAPAWAVCTNGIPIRTIPGRWSNNYAQPAVEAAYENFFTNDVVGDLQGNYDRVWAAVASYFKDDPWVLGYDPFNEPTGGTSTVIHNAPFDALLQCFYAGRADPGTVNEAGAQEGGSQSGAVGGKPPACPPSDPAKGVIAAIEQADPNHLVFPETDIASDGVPTYIGPMPYPRLVLNFHNYCVFRLNNGNVEPGESSNCALLEALTFTRRSAERGADATPEQPGGPAWFMSEFGATDSLGDLARVTADADDDLIGWTYWMWKYYEDPTGSVNEALVASNGQLLPKVSILSRTYAQAVAGTPLSMSFDPNSGAFSLSYRPNDRIHAPTVVFVPVFEHYPHGYCPEVTGGRIISKPGSERLLVENLQGASLVTVSVGEGPC